MSFILGTESFGGILNIYKMDTTMTTTGVSTGLDIMKQISLINPILALLLLLLFAAVYVLYKKLSAKEEEIKGLNLLLTNKEDEEKLTELKNLILRLTDIEEEQNTTMTNYYSKFDRIGDELNRLSIKLDSLKV